MSLAQIIEVVFCFIATTSSFYILFTDKINYAIYALLLCLISVAALFVLHYAEFVAATQILVYVGGILVVLIFGLVLSRKSLKKGEIEPKENFIQKLISISTVLLSSFVWLSMVNIKEETINTKSGIRFIGLEMLGSQVLHLELIGVLLLVILIGTTFILRHDR